MDVMNYLLVSILLLIGEYYTSNGSIFLVLRGDDNSGRKLFVTDDDGADKMNGHRMTRVDI